MEFDKLLLIILPIIALAYSLFYLIKGSKVKVICKPANKITIYIIYLLLGIAVLLKGINRLSIIAFVVIIISGIIYSLIPSGYDNQGIYISGRFYPYNKISSMEFDEVNGYYQLSFSYHGKYHVLTGSSIDKEKLKYALNIYNSRKII